MSDVNASQHDKQAWRASHPSRWIRFNHAVVTLCGRLAAALFATIAVMITYEVIARYIFLAPTIWVEDLSLLCQIWASCMGASWLLQHQALIRIDILTTRFGPHMRVFAELWSLLVVALFSAWVAWYGTELVIESIAMGSASASMLGLPMWITKSAIPVGFGLLFVQCLTEAVLVLGGHLQAAEEVNI
ncbi:TRAP transporter small permease [Marinobacterium sediminicola]|uniref:TRAP transporter small permease protein n=1 Tax=Marinobacterium sediminicola TaxID=518898 RepID=A0ABY1S1U2_9GAMM|nr:TRAP transporter small permease [Marinobacterium sediminicola]ULG69499.1 TRAP transporter small permease [Marinobacterium sediminicola]SMR75649.1 TRAP-type C4-dicarboxylate transport system, small permease component [Marinobacterium sediminicola]